MFIRHLISYYHYVDNNVLLLPFDFEEVKHHHLEQALQQLVQDENGPDARTIIDMILLDSGKCEDCLQRS